jgi:endonuclease III
VKDILDKLEGRYGTVSTTAADPLELILEENVAYLADDRRRAAALGALREKVGLSPERILEAPRPLLVGIAKLGGIHAEKRADRLREIAELASELHPRDALRLPTARRELKRYPGIGDPGADRILLLTRTAAVPAFESNGLRVLLRLGFGEEKKGYAATYRSVCAEVEGGFDLLIRAHHLLRRHGKELCRRADPWCEECPLVRACPFYRRSSSGPEGRNPE